MKLSQTIFLLIIINVLFVFFNFTTSYSSIEDLESNVINELTDRIDIFDDYTTETSKSENWFIAQFSSLIGGMVDAFNLVKIGWNVIIMILGLYVHPVTEMFFAEEVTILGFLGLLGNVYLWWFNIFAGTKLWKFLKGSEG